MRHTSFGMEGSLTRLGVGTTIVFTIEGHGSPFDWDKNNRRHVQEAGVEAHEAEEAALDGGRIGTAAYNVGTEQRWALLGATEEGRVLFVVFTHRGQEIRIITARDAERSEKRRYRRKGK